MNYWYIRIGHNHWWVASHLMDGRLRVLRNGDYRYVMARDVEEVRMEQRVWN